MTAQQPHRDPNARTLATYRAQVKAYVDETLRDEADPHVWQQFREQLARLGRDLTPGAFLGWLRASRVPLQPVNVRYIALRMIGARQDRIRVSRGLDELDCPLPVELGGADSVLHRAKQILGVR